MYCCIVHTFEGQDVASNTVGEGASEGATVGALIGGALGLVAVAGIAGPLGAVVAAGPIATALGFTGAVGATLTNAAAGAVAGGLVGALMSLSASEATAHTYEEGVKAGQVLVSVHTNDEEGVVEVLRECGATEIDVIEENM